MLNLDPGKSAGHDIRRCTRYRKIDHFPNGRSPYVGAGEIASRSGVPFRRARWAVEDISPDGFLHEHMRGLPQLVSGRCELLQKLKDVDGFCVKASKLRLSSGAGPGVGAAIASPSD